MKSEHEINEVREVFSQIFSGRIESNFDPSQQVLLRLVKATLDWTTDNPTGHQVASVLDQFLRLAQRSELAIAEASSDEPISVPEAVR